jgi:glycosyltransferase involved in cell wall biosynthesis
LIPANTSAPRILEIGQAPRMHYAYPRTTMFFSTYVMDSARSKPPGSTLVSAMTMAPLARCLSDPELDLVVVHASPHGIVEGLVRTIFRRSALRGHFPIFRGFAQQLVRLPTSAPVAVLDLHDASSIAACNRHLLRKATLYFKRELPPDRWQLLMNGGKPPTLRYRRNTGTLSALARVRPLSLGLPERMLACGAPAVPAMGKDIDVFFAGQLTGSSTVRERGVEELMTLRREGFRIEIQDGNLSPAEYLARCARAWLVWAPQGYGWDCFRSYEAAFAGSVPLISQQTIERHEPLADNEHAVYYNVEPGQLALTVRRALNDRDRLLTMAQAAREQVLRHHTPQALARHVVETTLVAARRSDPAGQPEPSGG